MAGQAGFVRARLHRALDDGVKFRFINIAQWATGIAFDRARTNPDFRSEGQRVLDDPDLHISGRPAPYQVALDVRPGGLRGNDDDDLGQPRSNMGAETKDELDSGPDALVAEPVTQINLFTVPSGESEQFLRHWRRSAQIMAAQSGFVRARLHRALDDGVEFRFINIAQWASGTAFDRARTNPDFRSEGQRVLGDPDLHISGRPAPYQIAIDVHPGDRP